MTLGSWPTMEESVRWYQKLALRAFAARAPTCQLRQAHVYRDRDDVRWFLGKAKSRRDEVRQLGERAKKGPW